MITATAKRLFLLALVALLSPACITNGPVIIVFLPDHTAVLSRSQVVPALPTNPLGSAIFKIATTETTIDYTVTHTVALPTSVEIHWGAPGVNGPMIFLLTAIPSGTLTPADFSAAPAEGINTFVDACEAMKAGATYVIVNSTAFPGGDIRGQIGPVGLKAAKITGAHAVPASPATATASATFLVDQVVDPLAPLPPTINVTLTSTGLSLGTVTGVFIHSGIPGSPSTIANTIFTLFSAGTFTNPFSVTLTPSHFTPQAGVATYDDALNALLSGATYIEVETPTTLTAGPIRGQIGAMRFATTTFDGTQEAPPIVVGGSGTGSIALNGAQDSLTYTATYTALTAAPTSAAIRVAPSMLNGPVLFTLDTSTAPAVAGTLSGLLQAKDIDAGSGLLTFDEVIEAMLNGDTYFELRTAANPSGEIRGQLGP